jgi:hypothetical protein
MVSMRAILCGWCLLLAACSSVVPAPPRPFQGLVVVRSYEDRFRLDDGTDEIRRVEYAWDYDQGVAVETIYRRDGKVLQRQPMPGLTLQPTAAELEHAYRLVREAPELRTITRRPDLSLTGGFSLREPDHRHCAAQSRCVHIMGTTPPDDRVVLHAIVDLMSNRVVDPHYDGSGAGGVAKGGEGQ